MLIKLLIDCGMSDYIHVSLDGAMEITGQKAQAHRLQKPFKP